MRILVRESCGRLVFAQTLNMKWSVLLFAGCLGWGLVGLIPTVHGATGDGIQIVPTRIVLEGRTRTEQVMVINKGLTSATYRLRFKNMRMTEAGEYEDIANTTDALPGEQFVADLIRFSPRQVEIAPGESQVVRLLLRKPKNLPEGEYRSHLLFQSVPPESSGKNIEVIAGDEQTIGISLIPIYGVTIPVIVRHGHLSATTAIIDPALTWSRETDQSPSLSFHLTRQGTHSVFGNSSVTWLRPDAEPVEVGRVNGISLFTPNTRRMLTQSLTFPEGQVPTQGKLHIQYREPEHQGGKLLTEAFVPLH